MLGLFDAQKISTSATQQETKTATHFHSLDSSPLLSPNTKTLTNRTRN